MLNFLKKKLQAKKDEYEFYSAYLGNIERIVTNKAIRFEIFMEFCQNLETVDIKGKAYSCSKVTYNGKSKWAYCKGGMNIEEALYKLADEFYKDGRN